MNAMHCVASEGGRLTTNECNALCGERRWKVNKK